MTPARYARIRQMLAARQTDLTVCLDSVHKPHNLAAILRTCDAVGIHQLHRVWDLPERIRKGTSVGSELWVQQCHHPSTEAALDTLQARGLQIVVTHLSPTAQDFRSLDYTRPTAVMFGQEKYGVSEAVVARADAHISIPMLGMVQSLNVSVAAALVLYEAQRQRQLAGLYDTPSLSEEVCQQILFARGHPRLYALCQAKQLALPHIDAHGQIKASACWWTAMGATPANPPG